MHMRARMRVHVYGVMERDHLKKGYTRIEVQSEKRPVKEGLLVESTEGQEIK